MASNEIPERLNLARRVAHCPVCGLRDPWHVQQADAVQQFFDIQMQLRALATHPAFRDRRFSLTLQGLVHVMEELDARVRMLRCV